MKQRFYSLASLQLNKTMVFFLMYEYVMYAQINIANVFKLLILAFVEEMSIQEALYVFRS